MTRTPPPTLEGYLAALPPEQRAVLERVRATIRKALPDTTEGISYRIPIVRRRGRMVLHYAAFRDHWSIFPASARVLAELGDELADRLHGEATLRFPYTSVPARLIARIAKVRAAEVEDEEQARSARRKPKR